MTIDQAHLPKELERAASDARRRINERHTTAVRVAQQTRNRSQAFVDHEESDSCCGGRPTADRQDEISIRSAHRFSHSLSHFSEDSSQADAALGEALAAVETIVSAYNRSDNRVAALPEALAALARL